MDKAVEVHVLEVAATDEAAVDLYWIPLGAGGHSVRFNGVVYEAISSLIQRRSRCDLYHSALEIRMPTSLWTVEMTPVQGRRGRERGVVAEGAVGTTWAGRLRIFRYEIRRWCDGVVPDLQYAVASPIRVTTDPLVARHLLELLPSVPTPVWAATSCTPARCGAATPSSRGSSTVPGSTPRQSRFQHVDGHQDGTQGSRSPDERTRHHFSGRLPEARARQPRLGR